MIDQYWYCGISMKGIKTIYSYISDTGKLQPGTYVMVPFGSKNALRIGVVKSCAEYTPEKAPYPVEQTKHIVREATAEEYENQPPISPYYRCGDIQEELDEVSISIETEAWDDVSEWAYCHYDDTDERLAKKAVECYELCIKHGIPEAALDLGRIYYPGTTVVKQNFQKAYEYFSLGVLLYNDAKCLCKLGDMYLNGYHVVKNEKFAFFLYQRSLHCCQENEADAACTADAQFRVGKCYLYGIGTYKNTEKAYELLSLALVNFYKKRKTDFFVIGRIRATKELLSLAQEQLDAETSDYQRNPDDSSDNS